MIDPWPAHSGHGCWIEKKPWLSESTPRPPQRGHTRGEVPGFAPEPAAGPARLGRRDRDGDLGAAHRLVEAQLNLGLEVAARAAPRRRAAAAREELAEDVAEVGGEAAAREAPRAARPPPGPPKPNMPPASYCLRFSGSESVS